MSMRLHPVGTMVNCAPAGEQGNTKPQKTGRCKSMDPPGAPSVVEGTPLTLHALCMHPSHPCKWSTVVGMPWLQGFVYVQLPAAGWAKENMALIWGNLTWSQIGCFPCDLTP